MNQVQIGNFIQQLRKEKNMTQKDLAEKLGISDKTVSKWETGKGLPDIESLTTLCSILEISVNELLSGERISSTDYSRKAEENIMNLYKDNSENKKNELWLSIIGAILIVLGLIFTFVLSGLSIIYFLDFPRLLSVAFITAGIVFLSGARGKQQIVHMTKKIIVPVGAIIALVTFVALMHDLSDPQTIGPNLAVLILTLLYSIIFYIIFSIIEFRMNRDSKNSIQPTE